MQRLLIEETNGRHQESLWVANGNVQQRGKRASVYPVSHHLSSMTEGGSAVNRLAL